MIHILIFVFVLLLLLLRKKREKNQKEDKKEAIKNNCNTFSGESSVHQITARLMFAKASGQTIRKTR